ncbi:MAG: transposase [Prevotella sp.]|nr:transposase [Prevotella sp.]
MGRKPREKSGTGIYHVMLRGVNRQDIFEDEEDYAVFKKQLYRVVFYKDESGRPQPPRCAIYAYCLMTNHVHLLVRETIEDLSTVIKRITVGYALYYNSKYQHIGHLFQNRFRSEVVNDEGYFLTLLRYIHQNPVAAGITKTVEDYRWSSWGEYENYRVGKQTICTIQPVLKLMPFADLRALVFELLPKASLILDFDNEGGRRSDDEIKAFLSDSFGLRQPTDIQLYSRDRRLDILRMAKQYGASIRQLERLTGISFTIIRTA